MDEITRTYAYMGPKDLITVLLTPSVNRGTARSAYEYSREPTSTAVCHPCTHMYA